MISIPGFDPTATSDPVPVAVDRFYDRRSRTWIVTLRDGAGNQVGDAEVVGTRSGADAAERELRTRIPGAPEQPTNGR